MNNFLRCFVHNSLQVFVVFLLNTGILKKLFKLLKMIISSNCKIV